MFEITTTQEDIFCPLDISISHPLLSRWLVHGSRWCTWSISSPVVLFSVLTLRSELSEMKIYQDQDQDLSLKIVQLHLLQFWYSKATS